MIIGKIKRLLKMPKLALVVSLLSGAAVLIIACPALAVVNPQNGSIGVEGNISSVAPTSPATISTPSPGQVLSSNPVTIAGVCKNGLLIEIYDNSIFSGSVACSGGSYSLQIDLFNGVNNLVAEDFNLQNQQGPNSSTVSVTFNGGPFTTFTSQLIFTTDYARRGAGVNQQISWPISVSGGTPPYAISVNWGAGSKATVLSQSIAGSLSLTNIYTSSGTYEITFQGTDKSNDTAFLQTVAIISGPAAQSSGAAASASATPPSTKITTQAIISFIVIIIMLPFSFFLGRRHQIYTLRKRLEESERSAR
jgi:hypothetical protein